MYSQINLAKSTFAQHLANPVKVHCGAGCRTLIIETLLDVLDNLVDSLGPGRHAHDHISHALIRLKPFILQHVLLLHFLLRFLLLSFAFALSRLLLFLLLVRHIVVAQTALILNVVVLFDLGLLVTLLDLLVLQLHGVQRSKHLLVELLLVLGFGIQHVRLLVNYHVLIWDLFAPFFDVVVMQVLGLVSGDRSGGDAFVVCVLRGLALVLLHHWLGLVVELLGLSLLLLKLLLVLKFLITNELDFSFLLVGTA